jgi:hypothetical protein
MRRVISAGLVTRLRPKQPRDRNSIPGNGKSFLSLADYQKKLWGGYRDIFTGSKAAGT